MKMYGQVSKARLRMEDEFVTCRIGGAIEMSVAFSVNGKNAKS